MKNIKESRIKYTYSYPKVSERDQDIYDLKNQDHGGKRDVLRRVQHSLLLPLEAFVDLKVGRPVVGTENSGSMFSSVPQRREDKKLEFRVIRVARLIGPRAQRKRSHRIPV